MGSPGEVSQPRKPKKVRGEWLWNFEWELTCAVTLFDANGKFDSVATETKNRVGNEVAILQARKLVNHSLTRLFFRYLPPGINPGTPAVTTLLNLCLVSMWLISSKASSGRQEILKFSRARSGVLAVVRTAVPR